VVTAGVCQTFIKIGLLGSLEDKGYCAYPPRELAALLRSCSWIFAVKARDGKKVMIDI